jgi:magnesium chelatase family protein
MSVAVTYSRAAVGIQAPLITVETDISSGLPKVIIVGLPETAVKESKDRVKAAMANSGYAMPAKRITINLSPADIPKSGGRYDLAIAVSILAAMEVVSIETISHYELLGELALNGQIRSVTGILPAAIQNTGVDRDLIVPVSNGDEAALVKSAQILAAPTLSAVIGHLSDCQLLMPVSPKRKPPASSASSVRLSDVKGQALAKRALKIAAAGGHNLIFIGPPGSGKTMLARRLAALIPPMSAEEALATASVQSVSKYSFSNVSFGARPFRSPHHTASAVALVGGGSPPGPGEISLAHNGVLFLDELPEFPRHVLEVLREPLESGEIIISRAHYHVTYPANFQLIAAMNPCPCGYYGDDTDRCECTIDSVARYRARISGPLLDRIDLHVDVPALPPAVLTASGPEGLQDGLAEDAETRDLISQVFHMTQQLRGKTNAALTNREIEAHCRLHDKDLQKLENALQVLGLSARGYYKVLKVARTIADLDHQASIASHHLTEALGFRTLDRYRTFDQ